MPHHYPPLLGVVDRERVLSPPRAVCRERVTPSAGLWDREGFPPAGAVGRGRVAPSAGL
jgi:hypothetical protein